MPTKQQEKCIQHKWYYGILTISAISSYIVDKGRLHLSPDKPLLSEQAIN